MWVTLKAPLLQGKVSSHNGLMGHLMSGGNILGPYLQQSPLLIFGKEQQFKEKGLYTATWAKWKCDSSFALPLRSSVDSFPLWIIVLRTSDAVGCVCMCACPVSEVNQNLDQLTSILVLFLYIICVECRKKLCVDGKLVYSLNKSWGCLIELIIPILPLSWHGFKSLRPLLVELFVEKNLSSLHATLSHSDPGSLF